MDNATDLGPDFAAGFAADDIPDGGMITGHIRGTKALLSRLSNEVFAVGAICSHLGGPLHQGLVVDQAVRCPWHHACFSLRSGKPLTAPAFDPLPRWEVTVEGGFVRVGTQAPALTPVRPPRNTGSDDRFVVIGGGAAGFAAVDMLLRSGFSGEITMISDDTAPPYDRTLLTKDYLDGHFGDDHLPLSHRDLFSRDGVEIILRTKVARIDPTAMQLTLEDGRPLSYTKLLLGQRRRTKAPGFFRSQLPHVKLLRSLEDCRGIITAAQAARNIVVVGGSFVGLEAAAALSDRGHKVSVVTPEEHPMAQIFGSQLAEMIAAAHRDHGVRWYVGRKIELATQHNVRLDDGTLLDADLLVVGIGVAPRVALAQAGGVAVDDGVLVNEYLATSAPDIFAAGDIARWPDLYSGGHIRVEHWVVAERQGQVAALNMMGRRQRYVAVPFFWTKHFGLSIRYVGHATSWDELKVEGDLPGRDGLVRFVKRRRLLAVATVERDVAALEEERAWEVAGGPRAVT